MPVRLHLFGAPTAEVDGASIALPFERRSQLLAFLALKRAWVGRAEVASLLWPDQAANLAYSNLRKTLFRLQDASWAGSAVEVQGGALRFQPETDVAAFEAAIREGRTAEALRERRGELLAGFDGASSEAWSSWLAFERERLSSAWRGAALSRLAEEIDPAEGIELSARLLEADPLDEGALRAHMEWLARGGQPGQARQAYREFVRRLQEDLGLAPGAELKALHDAVGGAAASSLRPATVPARGDEGFVGRSLELRRVAQLLGEGDGRLICLIGPGGVGKTRLARRVLEELGGGYPDGAAFVALEDAADAQEMGTQIARALDVGLAGRAEPMSQVIEWLRTRRTLLVLDNLEHLVPHAAALDRLLRACPRTQLLVTSRVRLALAQEHLLPLDGLPCPEPEDLDRLDAFDAVRLFVAAARRVAPELAVDTEAVAIADICRQVDGLPLALELAAAWTRVLSCSQIAQELRQGTELLRAVDAAHPARHASIEMVFDHSWRLLAPAERDALARLSSFRGGFAVDAARGVAGASLPILGALHDKSLLRREGDRLYLHPLVQQLAGLRLADVATREATHRAHAQHFHRLLAQLRRPVDDGDREALRRVDAEVQNCRVAWRWAIANAAPDSLARSLQTVLHYCDHRGRLEGGLALLVEALDSPLAAANPRLGAQLRSASAHLQYRLDRYPQAEADAVRALEATRGTDDHHTRLQCFKVLGGCCVRLGRLDDARRHFRQALKLAPAEVDPHNAAAMLDNLAIVEKRSGNYDEALRLSLESLAQHRRLDDVAGVSLCLNNLGSFYLERGEYAAAMPHLREALALTEQHGHVTTRALVLANLTEVAMRTGELAEADRQGARALEVARSAGNRALAAYVEVQVALVAVRRADLAAARAGLARALDAAIAIGRPSLLLAGVCAFAELLLAQGEAQCARSVLAFAADHPGIGATERDHVRKLLQESAVAGAPRAWNGMELDELARRIVAERDLAHAPLVAALIQ